MITDKGLSEMTNPTGISEIEVPTPREIPQRDPSVPVRPFDDIFEKNKNLGFENNTGFHGGPSRRRKGYKLALWSLMAMMIDVLILISLTSLFISAFSLIMNSPPGQIFKSLGQSQHRMLFFIQVMAFGSWIYMISLRGLMGFSVGEWACDLRLGQPQERLSSLYVFRVALRTTLIIASGIVVLPILSLISGRDVPGMLTGIKLFSLK